MIGLVLILGFLGIVWAIGVWASWHTKANNLKDHSTYIEKHRKEDK